MMECADCQRQLENYVLGELPTTTLEAIQAHLDQPCADCRQEMAELIRSIDQFMDESPLMPSASETWTKVTHQLDQPAAGIAPTVKRRGDRFNWVVGLASLAAVFMLVVGIDAVRPRQTVVIVPDDSAMSDSLGLAEPDARPPSARTVSMHAPEPSRPMSGSLLLDPVLQQLHVHVELKQSKMLRQEARLWFVTPDRQWILGGTLPRLNSDHLGGVFDIPAATPPVSYCVVTLEPVGSEPAPEGDVALKSDSFAEAASQTL